MAIEMTARRYSHWIKGRREKLEDELKKSCSHLVAVIPVPQENITFKGIKKKGGGPGLPASPYSPFGESD